MSYLQKYLHAPTRLEPVHRNSFGSRGQIRAVHHCYTDKYRLLTPVPRKLEEIERRREKSKMLVDILLLLAGLVFSIDEPDVDKR